MGNSIPGLVFFAAREGPDWQNTLSKFEIFIPYFGVRKLTRSGLKGVLERGTLKDKFAFFEADKESPIPKRRKLLAKSPFYEQKGPVLNAL